MKMIGSEFHMTIPLKKTPKVEFTYQTQKI